MKIHNTLSRSIETFTPLHDKEVGVYTCGPTVYGRAHLGNMRTYLLADVLVRTFRFLGYHLTHVMNITDIDDKMIARAHQEGIALSDLAKRYEDLFFGDIAKLNIEQADVYPRATEHFPEMKQLLNILLDKGFAYEKNGEAYFDISAFKAYGRLSRLDKRQIKPGARVKVDEYDKDDVNDFALWKIDGAPRPGWHLECSAISMKYLGPTFDIHIAGVDLIFPHNENEIAQSEAATEKPFVRYFVHGEHMLVEGQKMSKSLGNTFTVADIEGRGIAPLAYRYLVLSTHYRSKLNFTWDSLESAERTLEGIRQLAYRESTHTPEKKRTLLAEGMSVLKEDLDTPKLLALLHQANDYYLWQAFEPVLGLGLESSQALGEKSPKLAALLEQYEAARKMKAYVQSDTYRKEIEQLGYIVEDTETGTRLIPSRKAIDN